MIQIPTIETWLTERHQYTKSSEPKFRVESPISFSEDPQLGLTSGRCSEAEKRPYLQADAMDNRCHSSIAVDHRATEFRDTRKADAG